MLNCWQYQVQCSDKLDVKIYNVYILTSAVIMLTLDELQNETGINRNTLTKYRDLGLIPKPTIIHRGYKKEGPRGNGSLYPEYTPFLIREIQRLKGKPYQYSLSRIRDELDKYKIEDITPKQEISEPVESDYGHAILKMGPRLDKHSSGYERIWAEYETGYDDGRLRLTKLWGRPKKDASTSDSGV